jgi:hypothetical protein
MHVCAQVGTYRRFAGTHVLPGDTVVELGAAEGHTTMRLAKAAQRVIAVEKSAANVALARERCARYDNITFVNADAFDAGRVLAQTESAEVVFVDIGGSTGPGICLHLASTYRYLFRPRLMVIRNVELNDFVCGVGSCETTSRPGLWRNPHKGGARRPTAAEATRPLAAGLKPAETEGGEPHDS